jgi:hypothetical protein
MRKTVIVMAASVGLLAIPHHGAAATDIFVNDSTVSLTLAAPFTELFSHPVSDDDFHVTGELTWTEDGQPPVTLKHVLVSARGHTSRQASECSFPKLKINLAEVDRSGTPFEGIRTLKVGTHCGDRADDDLTPKYGRLANEHAPLRESMVYRMLDAAGIPTLRSRPARVSYIFDRSGREPLTRFALLLEDDDDAEARLGGSGQLDESTFGSARELFDARDTARLAFAQAMVGNFDWCLRMFRGDIYRCDERHPLWNVLALQREGKRALPLPYDFDLAGAVVGRHNWFGQVFSEEFFEPPSRVQVEVEAQVQRTRSLFDRALLDDTRAHFRGVRQGVMGAIERSASDGPGKALAREYVEEFYAAIDSDERFYRPVIVEGEHQASLDAEGARPACGRSSVIPQGTPVSSPIETRGGYARVRLLDALWQWTGNERCDTVHRQPVWVPVSAIGTGYPR